ncbi:MAG: dockerin type I repeat-containing protein, partial [Clostridia bacterium]|nr:dockerin type I repeat-containing protein [Clostridia bacterium]
TTAVFDADYEMHRSEINGRYYMNLPYFGSYDNKLIYHNGESILAFDPIALTAKTLETPVTDNKITLLYVSGNTVNYIIGTSDTKAEGEFKTLVLTKGLAGDIDGNGELSALDYIMLKRAVMSGIELSVSQDIWDVNADGLFSLLDYITLKRVVMGTYVLN